MKGDPKVVELLNEALKAELTAINQYWLHYRLLDNWGVKKLAEFERHESIDEMKHADRFAERILFLDGLPNFQALGRLRIGENVEEMLKADLEAEMRRWRCTARARRYCESVHDYVSRDLFTDVLKTEEHHVDMLETQFEMIARMGIQNYVQLQCEAARGRGLDPAEALVARLAAEAAGRGAGHQRVGRLVEQLDGLIEQPAQLHHLGHQLVREATALHAEARRGLDQLGDLGQRLRAELARFALERMRGDDQRGGVLLAHRLLDLRDRLDAVFLEIAEDSDEARPELGPALLEMHPVDDVPSFVGHTKLLKRRIDPAVVPPPPE